MTMLITAAASLALLAGVASLSPEPQTAPVRPAPDAKAYAEASWPAHNTALYAKDLQGRKLPVALGKETWLTEKKDLAGKVLVLDFWATWCGPCIAAEPKLEAVQKAHEGKVQVVGISGQRDPIERVRSHLDEHQPRWVYLHDDEQRVFKPFESRGIPLVVVVSTDGVVRWMGNPHQEDFTDVVRKVVEADPMVRAQTPG